MSGVVTDRSADLRAALDARRRELVRDIHDRLREGRTARPHVVGDMGDLSDADIQEDLDHSLLQMRAETLNRIDDAIARLDDGKYGRCVECDGEIAARRLQALPFAVRCRTCEERRELPTAERRAGLLIDLAVSRS
jgi:DnaK suppressor protein